MDSCNVNIINKIEFHGVRNTYPGGELASCYFTVPSTYRPEVGDWIGIYPVGWSSVGHYVAKRTVKPENVWSTPSGQQYGKVDFDGELLPKAAEQYYQFVYVKNGEYVRGASTPFMFGGEISQEINTIFGGKQQQQQKEQQLQQEWLQQQLQQQQQPRNLEQVEREMQKLQNGIFGLEQGLVGYKTVFPLIEEATTIEQQLTKPYGQEWNKWNAQPAGTTLGEMLEQQLQYQQQPQQPIQARKHWQSRVAEVQQMLVESLRVEQAARRIEQQAVLGQLKSCERHIQAVQKHEQAIREHLRAKAAVKVAEFEQKVYQIVKQQQQQPEYLQVAQPQQPEHYVRKYEQLLKEKVELEVAKRAAVMHKMRQTVRECERKLREIQIGEQQHFARFQQQLKAKIAGVQQPCGPAEHEARETLKQLVKEFTHEQRKEQHNLAKAQKQIACVCAEICERLDEVKSVEIYGKLRVPTIQQLVNGGKYAFEQQQHVAHVQQLEQQLAELKATLRGAKKAEKYEQYEEQQPLTAAWTKKVAQKLRELEWTLRQEKEQQQLINGTEMPAVRALWYERRIQNIVQHIAQLEKQQQQPEQYFEESPVRMVAQLRDLEAELVECVQYKPAHKQQQIVAELCQQLQRVVREKLAEKLVEKSIEKQLQQESAVECFVQSGNHAAWKQVAQLERKLVQLKGMLVEKKQHQELKQRLGELEQQLTSATVGAGYSGKVHQQIRAVRQMLEQHNQQQQLQWAIQGQQQQPQQQQLHYLFAQPEQFIQHQQKYERICQLVADLECQVIEQQQQCPRGYPTTYGQQQKYEQCPRGFPTIYGQQQQQQPKWEQQGQKSGLALVQQRFERLVQEFQQRVGGQQVQMPEWALQKVETIVQFVRQQQQEQTKLANKPYFGQQLREKIAEFEAILSIEQEQYNGQQEQPEKKQLIREVCRQARNLKQQTQAILDEWVLVSCQQNGEPQFEGDFNNNNTTGTVNGVEYEKITEQTILPEITLADLLSVRQQINECPRRNIETLEATIFEQQQLKEQRQAERQIERQIERQLEQQQEAAEYYGMASLQQQLQQPRIVNVESLIGELETELVKLRLQKECGPINGFYGQQPQQQPRETTTVTRVQMIGQNPETTVCDEITKIVGQNNSLLVPSLVAKVQQQQQQELGNGKTQQTNTQTVYNVEPSTPFGTTTVKVQQRETTQQF